MLMRWNIFYLSLACSIHQKSKKICICSCFLPSTSRLCKLPTKEKTHCHSPITSTMFWIQCILKFQWHAVKMWILRIIKRALVWIKGAIFKQQTNVLIIKKIKLSIKILAPNNKFDFKLQKKHAFCFFCPVFFMLDKRNNIVRNSLFRDAFSKLFSCPLLLRHFLNILRSQ